MPLLSSSAIRLLLAFSISFSLFLLYAKTHFYRDPGSAFFDIGRAHEKRFSALRLQEIEYARQALENHDYNGSGISASQEADSYSPELCVGITTARRSGLERQYVEDTLLSLLNGLTAQERFSIYLSLLFTDLDVTSHPTWRQPWLRSLTNDVWSYDSHNSTVTPAIHSWLRNVTLEKQLEIKAIMDYTLALDRCLEQTSSPYVAIFEGDILLAPGWVAPTLQGLHSADSLMQKVSRSWLGASKGSSKLEPPRDWLDMRLFNQERSTGWSSREVGGNHELVIVLGVDAALLLLAFCLRRRGSNNNTSSGSGVSGSCLALRRMLDNHVLALLCVLVVPACVVAFFQSGKASLLPPQPGLVVQNFGCCSQALVFKRRHVPGLIRYLRNLAFKQAEGAAERVGYDMLTRDFAGDNGLDRLALYPVLAQHLGSKSAMGHRESEASSVWSMAFEDLTAEQIDRRHAHAMGQLFGPDWADDAILGAV